MKKIALILVILIGTASCTNDSSTPLPVSPSFNFSHNWDGTAIENADFEVTQYTNAHGEILTLSKLIYLISDITFTSSTGVVYDTGDYNLINVRDGTNMTFAPTALIPPGNYSVSFTFGFDDEDNIDGAYLDLNSSDGSWNVPAMLGGGYHYMRMEGKYIDNTMTQTNFQYHTIRAANATVMPIVLQDTSIEVTLGQVTVSDNTNVEIKMNVAEWFKNPNLWDLNVLYTLLMPNFNAQVMMSENGASVFSLGDVTQ